MNYPHAYSAVAALCAVVSAIPAHAIELDTLDLNISKNRLSFDTATFDSSYIALDASGTLIDDFGFELGAASGTPSDTRRGASSIHRLSAALTFDVNDIVELGLYYDWGGYTWLTSHDTRTYGLQARLEHEDWSVTGYLGRSDYSALGVTDTAKTFGLDLQRRFGPRFAVGAFYDHETLSLADLQRYGLTLDWRLTKPGTVPVTLRASAGQHRLDGETSQNFALTLNIALKGDGRFDRGSFHPRSGFHDGFAITGLHSGPSAPTYCELYDCDD